MPTIMAREALPQAAAVEPSTVSTSQVLPPATPANTTTTDATAAQATPAVNEMTKQEQLSPRYAQLARKEKALRMEQQRIQREKEELKAKLTEYETSYIPKSKLTELAKTNPLGALEQMGLTPDEFTQALLHANPQEAAIQKMMARIDQLEAANQKTMTTMEQQQKQAYDHAVQQIRTDMKSMVQSDQRFETIKEADSKGWEATEGAVALIEEVFKEGWPEKKIPKGTVINNEEALSHIQEWVQTQAYEMAQLKGVKEKFQPAPPVVPVPAAPSSQAPSSSSSKAPAARTLSNTMNATKNTRLSDRERRERAIAALTGQLS